MRKRVDVVKNTKRGIADCAGARQKKMHLQLDEEQERKRRKRETSLRIPIRYIKDFAV